MYESREQYIRSYLDRTKALVDFLEESMIAKINTLLPIFLDAWRYERTIFTMGNGGSASAASHFANDLSKWTIEEGKPRIRAAALTDNVPLMLAWANDSAYEDIFVEQLKNCMRPGDIVVGMSGSGNSRNAVKALDYANQNGATTLALVGYDGGQCMKIARHTIHVPSFHMQQAENIHQVIYHLLTDMLKYEIKKESP